MAKKAAVELVSQIDIDHWTVKFLDGPWQGRVGDYKVFGGTPELDNGHKVEVKFEQYPKHPEPTSDKYCGRMEIVGPLQVEAPAKAKKAKVETKTVKKTKK